MRRVGVNRTLVDPGPRVAILSREDAYHQACVDALRGIATLLFSCSPVITRRHGSEAFSAGDPTTVEQAWIWAFGLLPLAGYEAKAIAPLRKDGPQEILAYSSGNLVSSWVGENFDFKI
jgi:hypothetical protein